MDAIQTTGVPAFTWNAISNGVNYQTQVDNHADFGSAESDDKAASTAAHQLHRLSMVCITADDTPGAWSAAQIVTIAVP